jgi:hypothetical protein
MPTAVPSSDVLISVEYDPTGLEWCRLYDNRLISWIVDETGLSLPRPVVIGTLPGETANTSPTISPQWAVCEGERAVFVPDLWRGSIADFFTWLATNGGASRKLEKRFGVSTALCNGFDTWRLNRSP